MFVDVFIRIRKRFLRSKGNVLQGGEKYITRSIKSIGIPVETMNLTQTHFTFAWIPTSN